MSQYLSYHRRVFHTGDDPYRTLALLAGFDVDVEYALQPLGPGHGGVALGGRSIIGAALFRSPGPLAPPRWGDGGAVSAVGCSPSRSRCAFHHAVGPAAGAEASSLTGKGHLLFMVTALAAYPQEAVLQAAALEKVGELLLHIVWQASAFGFQVGEESRVVPLDNPVE